MSEDISEWLVQQNKERGYLFCSECTEETNGNWEIWVNPHNLCKHLLAKMSQEEIDTAIMKYDDWHDSLPLKVKEKAYS